MAIASTPAVRGYRRPCGADRPRRRAAGAARPRGASRRIKGRWALPGGFVLRRRGPRRRPPTASCAEETGLGDRRSTSSSSPPTAHPAVTRGAGWSRSPTSRSCPTCPTPVAGSDAADARWRRSTPCSTPARLAFDHDRILGDGVERARAKLEYTPLAAAFCPAGSRSPSCGGSTRRLGHAARPAQLPPQGHRHARLRRDRRDDDPAGRPAGRALPGRRGHAAGAADAARLTAREDSVGMHRLSIGLDQV